ncbi:hypothetical protein B0H14DRAFT_1474646 [Mycena olivaceomarginata]|nr:hypothetical protein B0H14DRAFT_1474646 [Mycena olivaceomarginata]
MDLDTRPRARAQNISPSGTLHLRSSSFARHAHPALSHAGRTMNPTPRRRPRIPAPRGTLTPPRRRVHDPAPLSSRPPAARRRCRYMRSESHPIALILFPVSTCVFADVRAPTALHAYPVARHRLGAAAASSSSPTRKRCAARPLHVPAGSRPPRRPNLSCTTARAMRLRCAPIQARASLDTPRVDPTSSSGQTARSVRHPPARPLLLGSTDSACTLRPTSESGHTPAHSRPDLGRTIVRARSRPPASFISFTPFHSKSNVDSRSALRLSCPPDSCPSNPVSLVCFAPLRHLLSYCTS